MPDCIPRTPEPEAMDLEEEAAAYAEADFAEVNQAFVDRLVQVAAEMESPLALDLGTGPADIPRRLVLARPAWRVVAADVSWAMLHLAQRVPNVHLAQTDAKGLPFRDAAFDVVFSNSILHHISDTASLWAHVRRVAKPGALIFFRDLTRPATESEAAAIVAKYAGTESATLQEEYYRSLLSAYTVDEVKAQLREVGLRGLDVQKVTDRHIDIFGRV